MNGGGCSLCYVFTTSMCGTKNNGFPMKDRYSGFICQHSLANILYVSQRFIKLLHQPTKPLELVVLFTKRQRGNKDAYNYLDTFLHQIKADIGEPISTRYVIIISCCHGSDIYDVSC